MHRWRLLELKKNAIFAPAKSLFSQLGRAAISIVILIIINMKKRLLYTILSISLLTVMAGAAIAPALGVIGAHFGRELSAISPCRFGCHRHRQWNRCPVP